LAPDPPAADQMPPPCGLPGQTRRDSYGRCQPCTSRDNRTADAPFANRREAGCPASNRRARALSTRGAPTPQLPRLRNAFHPQSLENRPSLALGVTHQITPFTRALPPWPGVRHAFTHRSCALDRPRLDYSSWRGKPQAVYGFLQLKTIFEHTHEYAKPQRLAASRHQPDGTAPCRAMPAELSQPRDCRAPTLHNSHHATARKMVLPQPGFPRTPPVAS
jgi:hypothetical protein